MSNKWLFNKKNGAQTVIDYILLVTVVIVISLVFVAPGGMLTSKYEWTMMSILNTVTNIIADIKAGKFSP